MFERTSKTMVLCRYNTRLLKELSHLIASESLGLKLQLRKTSSAIRVDCLLH
jgi:hypothetical protein